MPDFSKISDGDVTYNVKDANARERLDTLEKNVVNKSDVDDALSSTSTNPVQNKVVKATLDKKASSASPVFTGTPKAPTPDKGDNTTRVATTEFVRTAIDEAVDATPTLLALVGSSMNADDINIDNDNILSDPNNNGTIMEKLTYYEEKVKKLEYLLYTVLGYAVPY